jgi:hypothetical protein
MGANVMEKVDYSAPSTVWILPWKTGISAQQIAGHHHVPLSEAIDTLMGLPPDQQQRAEIEIHGKPGRIGKDRAIEISQREDFPRD